MKKEEGVKHMDEMTKLKIYADEFWRDLELLLEEKYGFTVDDIVFSEERTHCEYCGGKLKEKEHRGLSRFTNDFGNFCYIIGKRRLEVEKRNSEQAPKEAEG